MGDSNRGPDEDLFDAMQDGDLELVQELLEEGRVDVNYNHVINEDDGEWMTVLHGACFYGHLEIATLLVDNGADIHARREDGQTPLLLVCEADNDEGVVHKEIIEMLVEKGADPNAQDINGYAPLMFLTCATSSDNLTLDSMQFLINNGADVDIRDRFNGATLLHAACVFNRRLGAAKLLIENGADIRAKDNNMRTPLNEACLFHNLEVAQLLVENGADIHSQDRKGLTPLHHACKLDAWMSSWRTQNDVELDAAACLLRQLELMKLLIDNGADIHAKDYRGWTPLHWACHDGRVEVVELLMSRSANVNAETNEGITPLQIACKQNHQSVVWWLVRFYPSLVLEQYE